MQFTATQMYIQSRNVLYNEVQSTKDTVMAYVQTAASQGLFTTSVSLSLCICRSRDAQDSLIRWASGAGFKARCTTFERVELVLDWDKE